MGGTSISPAPRLPRLDRLAPPRREPRLVERPLAEVAADRPEVADGREPAPDGPDGPVTGTADGAPAETPAGTAAGAIPHTLQYPSSISPVQPGVRVQLVMGTPAVVPAG
jgi:hypothetical protein